MLQAFRRLPTRISHLLILLLAFCQPGVQAQQSLSMTQTAPLTTDQVVSNLERKNQERARALRQFQGTRIYRMQYRGFPGDRDAEMVVHAQYTSPDQKQFTVLSQSGSKLIIDRVFLKLLDAEKEALQPESREHTALNTANYDFTMDHFEPVYGGGQYVLAVLPKSRDKFLYRGKIWVDAKDFAVTRIEAEPAKNPSFWIKKSEIRHRYIKVGDFWLPAENHTESQMRLGGRATLSIEYKDYKITQADPLNKAETTSQAASPTR